jgi:hypothetical protein
MSLSKAVKAALTSVALSASASCFAEDTYLSGTVTNLTSITSGILLKLDTGLPTNCIGSPWGWMLIRAENRPMTALLLTMYASGRKRATVYTVGVTQTGYCEISQYDPEE